MDEEAYCCREEPAGESKEGIWRLVDAAIVEQDVKDDEKDE